MCEVSYKPQDSDIGFLYNVILDGRMIGYVPASLTEYFIKKLRILKVQGKQVNTIYFQLYLCIFYYIAEIFC